MRKEKGNPKKGGRRRIRKSSFEAPRKGLKQLKSGLGLALKPCFVHYRQLFQGFKAPIYSFLACGSWLLCGSFCGFSENREAIKGFF